MTEMSVHVYGNYACFTRPEFKIERVSYPIITPSAAAGLLESIFWKPEFTWSITRIEVVKAGEWTQLKRNEINTKQKLTPGNKSLSTYKFDVEEKRVQTTSLMLKNVAYNIYGEILLKKHANDNIAKYQDQFRRRVNNGRCYSRPYLGTRECSADFRPVSPEDKPMKWDNEIGLMLKNINYTTTPATPNFFWANVQNGVLECSKKEGIKEFLSHPSMGLSGGEKNA